MEQKYTGYLFCYFTGKEETPMDEQVYFAISRDGLHWRDLNHRRPVLTATIGSGGVRDPFIIRLEKEQKYVILATDLQIAGGMSWQDAVHRGSTRMICWESADLVNWSQPYFFETGLSGAGCVWAPEAVYDIKNDQYMVFWSSLTTVENRKKHRIYCCTTPDFHHFTEPRLYLEHEKDVIDMTIFRDQDTYVRFFKDESAGKIIMETGRELRDGVYQKIDSPLLDSLTGVEGPAVLAFNDEPKWCLFVDRFAAQEGYLPLVTEDLKSGNFTPVPAAEYDFGKLKKRHGSVIKLTEEEWNTLESQEVTSGWK